MGAKQSKYSTYVGLHDEFLVFLLLRSFLISFLIDHIHISNHIPQKEQLQPFSINRFHAHWLSFFRPIILCSI